MSLGVHTVARRCVPPQAGPGRRKGDRFMKFGASMFFTDYSMAAGGARGRAGGARLRHRLGARAFAHPAVAQVGLHPGRRAAQALLRRHGPVRDADRRGGGDQDVEGRHRRLPGRPARSDPDRQAGRLDRPGLGRALRLRGRQWLEPDEMENHGTDFATRHKRARENIEAMKEIWTKSKAEYHGEFVNFDPDDDLAQAGAETAPADPGGRRLPLLGAPRDPLWRRLDAADDGEEPDAAGRADPAVPPDVRRSRPRRRQDGHLDRRADSRTSTW